MNQSDREALRAFSQQLDKLTKGVELLETLGKKETVEALEGLVRVAPTLVKLAEGYDAAGRVGGWFGRIVKWVGILAGALLGVATLLTNFIGDKP